MSQISRRTESEVTLIEDYARQHRWRAWPIIFDALPITVGQLVLDLGCGIGDVSSELSKLGARVIGVDGNEEVVEHARARGIENAEFRVAELRSFADATLQVDGIWSSFTAAYFTVLESTLGAWKKNLRSGGWICIVEIDNLFGHHPLPARVENLLEAYSRDSLEKGRYDFLAGRKLADCLQRAGFAICKSFTVPDAELSFVGAAPPEVIAAWQTRFGRMRLLQEFCGNDFQFVLDEFLKCLSREDHWSSAKVQCCIARGK